MNELRALRKEGKMEALKQCILTHASKQEPIVSNTLEIHFGISKVELMELIRGLRRSGTLVVGTSSGYYIGDTIKDVQTIKDDMVKRIQSMVKTVNDMCRHFGYEFNVVFFFERKKKETDPNQINLLDEVLDEIKDGVTR